MFSYCCMYVLEKDVNELNPSTTGTCGVDASRLASRGWAFTGIPVAGEAAPEPVGGTCAVVGL